MILSEIFDKLSAFYLELWQHLDALFDDNRWLRPYSVPDIDERSHAIHARYAALAAKLDKDPIMAEQVRRDFEEVELLIQEYLVLRLVRKSAREPEHGSQWFRRADKMRSYLQELGLRYAGLASTSVGG